MGIKGVDHIVVRVKDLEEGISTYRDKLGMELERTAESEAIGIKQAFLGTQLEQLGEDAHGSTPL